MKRVVAETSLDDLVKMGKQMPFATLLVNKEEKIVSVNEHFLTATASNLSDVLGAPCRTFVNFLTNVSLRESPIMWCEGEIVSANGERLFRSICCQCFKVQKQLFYLLSFINTSNGKVPRIVRLFAEKLVSDIHLGVLLFDQNGQLMVISDLACRILGVQRKDVLNKSLEEAFPEIRDEHGFLQKAVRDGLTVRNHVTSWSNGKQRFELLVDTNLIHDEKGCVVGASIIFKDVTNLRTLDEQIQRNDRLAMIGQIAAGTAHEIRNPLTSIKGFLQVLKYGLKEKGLIKEQGYTDIMLKEIDRINDLVGEFLLLSKSRDATYEEIHLLSVFKEILPIIQNEALLHKVDVHYEPDEHVPIVIADGERLKQVFLNICKNGIEAMPDGGELTIRVRYLRSAQKVVVEVHDTGPGIPHYVIDKIFDPFFTTKENGTGLGLPVCQRIVHDIGGSIRVSTKGFGTTFSILIPSHHKTGNRV